MGRVTLYLLDTATWRSTAPHPPHHQSALRGPDRGVRLRQELLLRIGGMRALRALEIPVAVTHMNEAHSAFLGLERVRTLMSEQGLSFAEARQVV